jgi:hypothetical protein
MKKTTLLIAAMFIATTSSLTTLAFEKTMGTPFPDIDYDAYYTSAVADMAATEIITGYENGNFGPNDPVTRAQLATILYRFNDKVIGGHYDDIPSPDNATRINDLKKLVCEGFEGMEGLSENSTYKAICINSLQ